MEEGNICLHGSYSKIQWMICSMCSNLLFAATMSPRCFTSSHRDKAWMLDASSNYRGKLELLLHMH